jgi:pimeloyl-ACP methyl ester carboxylesterase
LVTSFVETAHGVRLEVYSTGTGPPITAFAHGLGSGIAQTRPLGSGVAGRKVFMQFRGHGHSESPPGLWTYADLAHDLRAVADSCGATQALGVSLGAGALCRILAETPDRFARVVLFLPAVIDRPRGAGARQRFRRLLAAVEAKDPAAIAHVVALDIPPSQRGSTAAAAFIRSRVELLMREGLAHSLVTLPDQVAVSGRAELASVQAKVLIIGAEGDIAHPASVAVELGTLFPHARVHIYDQPAVLWTHRADLRDRISAFLNP